MKPKFKILTECGESIGYGHLMRTSILAEYIRKEYGLVHIVNFKGKYLSTGDIFNDFVIDNWIRNIDNLELSKNDIVLVDSYLIKNTHLNKISEKVSLLCVFDDYCRPNIVSDVIINPNIYSNKFNYKIKDIVVLEGQDFVLLREQIKNLRNKFLVKPDINIVTITLGGDDLRGILRLIIETLVNQNFNINVVCGNRTVFDKITKVFPGINALEYLSAPDLYELFLSSDLIISGSGQTMNELAYLGIPSISICLDDDQVNIHNAYFQNGFIKSKLFWDDPDFIRKLLVLIKEFNYGERKRVNEVGKNLIKYNEPLSVINKVLEAYDNKKRH